MTTEAVTDIIRDALYLILKTALPVLLISMAIGLIVSIFQTVTSIQEQTLTFVPKLIGIFLALMLFGNWMLNCMVDYTTELWNSFSYYIHRQSFELIKTIFTKTNESEQRVRTERTESKQ